MKLTPKQRKFADNYIKTGNATEAAIKAGYSKKTATVIGAENLIKPNVKSYIDERLNQASDNTIASAEEILQYLTRVVRAEEKEKSWKSNNGEIIEIELAPDIKDRTKAAELLGKRHRLFTDTLEIDVTVTKALEEWLDE